MLSKLKDDSMGWLLFIGALLLLVEITFFNTGVIFSLFVSGMMLYFGKKSYHRPSGKLFFWLGLFMFLSSVIGMITFRLFMLAALIYIFYQYTQSKKKPEVISPILTEPGQQDAKETVIEQTTLFKNTLFGHQETPDHVYDWNDVNLVTGIGDTVIDLSNTVLPKGETVIFIRGLVGNIKVYVPYDLEISVKHSSVVGTSNILDFEERRTFNQTLAVKTSGYDEEDQKVRIFTSMMIGNLEVKRR